MRWSRPLAGVLVTLGLLAGCAGTAPPGRSIPSVTASPSPTTTSTPPASPTHSPGTGRSPAPTATPSPTRSTPAPAVPPSRPRVGRDAWVAVSVATLWRSPRSPRPVDAPALGTPARIRAWLAGMSTADRLGLVGRADTQVLLGDRVVVTALSGRFAKVVVPDQPTPLDARGYPGWVPLAQLTASRPARAARTATVVARTTWLLADTPERGRVLEVSFGTRLPAMGTVDGAVRVGLPGGRVLRVPAAQVALTAGDAPALPAEGAALVRSATMFTGLPYLWAGTSGFGFDCSGLTYLVHRVHGVRIPRDAGPQSSAGMPVSRTSLRPGDLLFYTRNGAVHHVAMYAGGGRMVQSPSTGHSVETIPVAAASFASEFSGARRFVR